MKSCIFLSLVIATLTGCASAIPYTHEERCAREGMVLEGVLLGGGGGSAYNWQTGAIVTASSHYSGVSCRVPQTEAESCRINVLQSEMKPKEQYNSDIRSKVVINGIGYYLLIVPGVVAKVVYDGQKDDAVKQSEQIAEQNSGTCQFDRIPASAN
jgi:hypothetical protein